MPERLELHDLDRNRLWLGMRTGQWLDLRPATVDRIAKAKSRARRGGSRRQARPLQGESPRLTRYLAPQVSGLLGRRGARDLDLRRSPSVRRANVPGDGYPKASGPDGDLSRHVDRSRAEAADGSLRPGDHRPDDTAFDPEAPADVPLKRAMTGHVLVRPKIDGHDIGWFIFDTGAAGNVIDPKAMAKLKLEPLGTAAVTSVSRQRTELDHSGTSIALGPMTVAKPFFVTMELDYIREGMGEDVFGIIGHDILSRCVAEITVADDSIKLFDPKTYRLGPGSWQPLTIQSVGAGHLGHFRGRPQGTFPHRHGSGGPGGAGNVVFHAPAVNDLHLLKGRKVTRMKIGQDDVAMGKVAWFELAGHRFDHPDVVFAIDRQGTFGDEYVEGNIGVDFLKPFRMVLDFQNTSSRLPPARLGRASARTVIPLRRIAVACGKDPLAQLRFIRRRCSSRSSSRW